MVWRPWRAGKARLNTPMIRLDPPIPLDTPKGKSWAYFLVDRSQDHDFEWVVFIRDTGECWTYRNKDVRLETNITMGIRTGPSR